MNEGLIAEKRFYLKCEYLMKLVSRFRLGRTNYSELGL